MIRPDSTGAVAERLCLLLRAAVVFCLWATSALGQAPESERDPLPAPAAGPTEPSAPRSALVQTAIDSIQAGNPKTVAELLRAVHVLQRLGAHDDAKSYLDQAASRSNNANELVEAYQQLATGALVQIANDRNLGAEAHELVRSIFAAVRKSRTDPARIAQLIAALASTDAEQRRTAIVGLAEAGNLAIPHLIDAYRNPPDGVTSAQLDTVVRHMGRVAEGPLLAALAGSDADVQRVAARLLGDVGAERARIRLIRPSYAANDTLRQTALASVARLRYRLPKSRVAAAALLQEETLKQLSSVPRASLADDGMLETWTWSSEEQNVVALRLTPTEANAVAAARLAKDAFELDPSEQSRLLLLVSVLQSDQLLGGLDEPLRQGAGTAHDLAVKSGAGAVSEALALSLTHHLDAAAMGATEVLAAIGNPRLVTTGHPWSPLVRALQSPNRRVRFGAAKAIVTIDPRERYAGASFLVDTLTELSRVQGRPRALIGTPRQFVADQLAGELGGMGYQVARIATTRDLLREAMETSDYDVLFVSDAISRPSISEFVQQLRKDPQSRYLPVVLLVREDQLEYTERVASRDDRVFVLPELVDDVVIAETLLRAEQSVLGVAVPPLRRLEHAQAALAWLGHLAEYSRTYVAYDVMRSRAAAAAGVHVPELTDRAIDLLGFLGDQAAQQQLVDLASLPGGVNRSRQRAANAFTESVLRHGLMLPAADVAQQYERYQANVQSGTEEGQDVLRQILSVIETQTQSASATSP